MLTLKMLHLFFISLSIVITAGFGMWGLLNHHIAAGALSLAVGVALVVYGGYFVAKAQAAHLE